MTRSNVRKYTLNNRVCFDRNKSRRINLADSTVSLYFATCTMYWVVHSKGIQKLAHQVYAFTSCKAIFVDRGLSASTGAFRSQGRITPFGLKNIVEHFYFDDTERLI